MAFHQEQDALSLSLHTAAVKIMSENQEKYLAALSILTRWINSADKGEPLELYLEWLDILTRKDWEEVLSLSERGNQRRQASPCACILPMQTRLDIIKHEKRKS